MKKPIVISWGCKCNSTCDVYWIVKITTRRVTLSECTDYSDVKLGSVLISGARQLIDGKSARGFDGLDRAVFQPRTERGELTVGCQTIPKDIVGKIRKALRK